MFVVCRFQYLRLILSKQSTILANLSSRVEWEYKHFNENKNNSPTEKMILNKMKAVGAKEHQKKMILNNNPKDK
jgi:type IV secretory pathway component VirB8